MTRIPPPGAVSVELEASQVRVFNAAKCAGGDTGEMMIALFLGQSPRDAQAFAISVADASRLRHLLHIALNEPPPNPDAVVVPNPFE